MIIVLPAAFYSYFLVIMFRIYWVEPDDFWDRWVSEDSVSLSLSSSRARARAFSLSPPTP